MQCVDPLPLGYPDAEAVATLRVVSNELADTAAARDADEMIADLADDAQAQRLRAERMVFDRTRRLVIFDRLSAEIIAGARVDKALVIQVLDGWLQILCEDRPDVFAQSSFGQAQSEAKMWAEYANTTQLLTMLGACAVEAKARDCLQRAPQNQLKGLFMALWASFPSAIKRAFVDRVAKGPEA